MENKTIGYILMGIGVVAAALSFPVVRTALKIAMPSGIKDSYLIIAGAVLVLVGAWIGFRQAVPQHTEVPIYHGEKIVGYRRH